ncbi:MAG: hypothetical protein ACKOC5_04305 [Chloroflexota bacterium]
MKPVQSLSVRTGLQAGRKQDPNSGYYPGQPGWYWMSSGYIARPGRPMKAFTGWYYGPAPYQYNPRVYGSGMGAGAGAYGAPGDVGDGTLAPDAP